jgi:hypothetical protein
MTIDTRNSNDGRESDDWLGKGELDWGEPSTRPSLASSLGAARGAGAEDAWPPPADGQPDDATIRRRRAIALVAVLAVVGAVIVLAVVVLGGSGGNPSTPPATTTPPSQQGTQGTGGGSQTTTPPKTDTHPTTTPTQTTPASTSSQALTLAPGQTLKVGSSGPQVKQLQQALVTLGFQPGTTDGDFGAQTEAAVGAFQRAHNLADDGVVGPATAMALNQAVAAKTSG